MEHQTQHAQIPAGDAIPKEIIRMYPYVNAEAWERISPIRFQAPHPAGGLVLVVRLFGSIIGVGTRTDDDATIREAYAGLMQSAARDASHRVSCAEGTPIVRPGNVQPPGVCWWCGAYPSQHTDASRVVIHGADADVSRETSQDPEGDES